MLRGMKRMSRTTTPRLTNRAIVTAVLLPVRVVRRSYTRIRHRWNLLANYLYDLRRFKRYGSPDRALSLAGQQQAYLLMLAHSLEKGMTLPSPRLGFGRDKLQILLTQTAAYIRNHGDDWASQTAIQVIEAYLAFHANTTEAASLNVIATEVAALRSASRRWDPAVRGGTLPLHDSSAAEVNPLSIEAFLRSRHSIRHFRQQAVPLALIERAVALAQTTPSVCNRQAGRVHVIPRSAFADHVLQLQNGNRGFGNTASHVVVITSDVRCFLSIDERNQMWVDGGLFAMTLVHAFHGLGVGTCFLNWSADKERDTALRRRLPIPDWENVITMLAIGYAEDHIKACVSQRRPLGEVLTVHGVHSGALDIEVQRHTTRE